MKPRTKLDFRIKALSDKLLQPTDEQLGFAKRKCFRRWASVRKNGTAYCMECGHEWKLDAKPGKRLVCPHCGEKLSTEITLKRMNCDEAIFAMLHVIEGMQVVRLFYISKHEKIGHVAYYCVNEMVQQWYTDGNRRVIVARGTNNGSLSHSSNLEIRKENLSWCYANRYDFIPDCVCPGWKVLPVLKRNGFRGDFHGASPKELLNQLPYNSVAETLLKAKQYELFAAAINGRCLVRNCWPSIRVCIRNNYIVRDAVMWCDYIALLSYLGKDLRNAKYVCPRNLKAEHDRLVKKKRAQMDKEAAERKRDKAIHDENKFKQLKSAFFGLCFSIGNLKVEMLDSVDEIREEGDAMHHCVFTNEYYLKPDSLILSAKIDGKRVETVELSLKTMEVVQSRGACNKNTEHHDEIINLVNRNVKTIKKLYRNGKSDTRTAQGRAEARHR